mmetsp:Transcript_50000/g.88045  ORF Transcript_50000/g.88045 Transcript_50000/m.88045 type:complete len:566 (+) Transcript_50000:77-1774(+)
MFCCRGSNASEPGASKPRKGSSYKPGVTQDPTSPTLLTDHRAGDSETQIKDPIKESPANANAEAAVPEAKAHGENQPETSEKQQETKEVEPSAGALPVTSEPEPEQSVNVNAVSTGTHSSGLLRKQRTVVVDNNELDVMVTEFSCHDSSVLTALGKHSKEAKWKVQVGQDTDPVDITLHVDMGVVSGPAVQVSSNGRTVFKTAGGYTRKAMYDDFEHRWPFRGKIRGMHEPNVFELRPHALAAADEWFPATITGQREDGRLEVEAVMPGIDGFQQVSYPAVDKADLREAGTRQPLQIPERCLTLQVPRDDPLQACLSLDGKDLVTHHFARPSPTCRFLKKRMELCVSKDRSVVTGNVGHAMLSHFVTGEVRAVRSDIQTLRHSWTVQVGPFAEHTVLVEKKHRFSKIVSLSIDGQPFVEASAEDIDHHGDGWKCNFRFVGEKIIDFEVHESNRDGVTLDSKDHVLQKKKYVHECCVTLGDDMDMRTATFTVDSQDFRELPPRTPLHEEENISMSPQALNLTYGILVPYKVNHAAPCGIFGLPMSQRLSTTTSLKTGRRVRSMCCC